MSPGRARAALATLQESPAAPWLWGAAGVLDRLTRSVVDLGTLAERYFAPGSLVERGWGVHTPPRRN